MESAVGFMVYLGGCFYNEDRTYQFYYSIID